VQRSIVESYTIVKQELSCNIILYICFELSRNIPIYKHLMFLDILEARFYNTSNHICYYNHNIINGYLTHAGFTGLYVVLS